MSPSTGSRVVSGLYASLPRTTLLAAASEWSGSRSGARDPSWYLHLLESQIYALELRLDVDGPETLSRASGMVGGDGGAPIYWLAALSPFGGIPYRWMGKVEYIHGAPPLPPDLTIEIIIIIDPEGAASGPSATLTFKLKDLSSQPLVLRRISSCFRHLAVEIDREQDGLPMPLAIDPFKTGNSPAPETPALGTPVDLIGVYDRAGIRMSVSLAPAPIATDSAAANQEAEGDRWTDAELHQAMTQAWESYRNAPQWALWAFYADKYEERTCAGIMFDDEGYQRQGVAVFHEAFQKQYQGYAGSDADWLERHKFFTIAHEIGHAFNLLHSAEKDYATPWPYAQQNAAALSFMNQPFTWPGNTAEECEAAFFKDFYYRFAADELLFLRHAPEPFVQMGRSAWGHQHGLELPGAADSSAARLELVPGRADAVYEFLEPVYLDVILHNRSPRKLWVLPAALEGGHGLSVLIQRDGESPRRWRPLMHRLKFPEALAPGELLPAALLASVDRSGWLIREPGHYTIQAVLQAGKERVHSNCLRIEVRALGGAHTEVERFAQDYFSPEVARLFALGGSRAEEFAPAREVLAALIEAGPLSGTRTVRHARYLLARPWATVFKRVQMTRPPAAQGRPPAERRLHREAADAGRAVGLLTPLLQDPSAIEGFGAVEFIKRCLWYLDWLDPSLSFAAATGVRSNLERAIRTDYRARVHKALKARRARWNQDADPAQPGR